MPPQAPTADSAVMQRLLFWAWPQCAAHPSWLQALDRDCGLAVSRRCGPNVGAAEEAVARQLLLRCGARAGERLPLAPLPAWVMLPHTQLATHSSTVAALLVLPALQRTVSGAQARQWDAVLGPQVRRAALLLGQGGLAAPPHAAVLGRQALAAAASAQAWQVFSLELALAAASGLGAGVQSRLRLAWPASMCAVQPQRLEAALQPWLAEAFDKVDALGQASSGLATSSAHPSPRPEPATAMACELAA